jgi:hypothetical protein
MTPSIRWVADDVPSSGDKTPFVSAERFKGTGKTWRIWLLGDARPVAVHFKPGEKTMPCLAENGPCPFCADPQWWKRTEAYAPAMLEIKKLPDPCWQPILAIFTAGATKDLGPKPHRGKMFDVARTTQGSKCTPLRAKLIQVSDPLRPSFDIEPLIKRLWWPDDADICAVELPDPIPIPKEEVARAPFVPELQPVEMSAEERRKLAEKMEASGFKELAAKLRAGLPAEPPAAVVEPATALTGLQPGGPRQTDEMGNPANYGPVAFHGVGTAEKPLLDNPPVPDGKATTRAQMETLKQRREAQKRAEAEERYRAGAASRDAAEAGVRAGSERLAPVGDVLQQIVSGTHTNGTHGEQKGGA